MGVKVGYAMALDPANDRVWIRPFYSDKDIHPLTGIWSTGVGDRNMNYEGPCLYFAERSKELYIDEFITQEFGSMIMS